MADSSFDLTADLLAPRRTVPTLANRGFTAWLFGKLDGWLGLPTEGDKARVFWQLASLVSLGLTWAGWRLSLSMWRAWSNYTKGRLSPTTATGAVVSAVPAALATLITGYCLHRARMASAAPVTTEIPAK